MSSFLIPFILIAIYFFPTWLAGHRQHHNTGAIFVLNLFLGWTFIGWVLSLVWASTAVHPMPSRPEATIPPGATLIPPAQPEAPIAKRKAKSPLDTTFRWNGDD